MDTESRELGGTRVLLHSSSHSPQWPNACVVCDQPCTEMSELGSYVSWGPGHFRLNFKVGPRFSVPLHDACHSSFKHATPIWVYISGISLLALLGCLSFLIAKPGAEFPLMAFSATLCLMAFSAFTALVYPPYVRIMDQAPYYEFSFRSKKYANKFSSLNVNRIKTLQEAMKV